MAGQEGDEEEREEEGRSEQHSSERGSGGGAGANPTCAVGMGGAAEKASRQQHLQVVQCRNKTHSLQYKRHILQNQLAMEGAQDDSAAETELSMSVAALVVRATDATVGRK